MQHHAPIGVRRYQRPRAVVLLALGLLVSGGAAMAPSASTAPVEQPLADASHEVSIKQSPFPSHNDAVAVARAAVRAIESAPAVATVTTVSSDRNSIRSGGSVKLTGHVTANSSRIPSQTVTLQVKSGNTWHEVSSRVSSIDGYVAFTVRPTKSATYRLAYAGVPSLAASVSAVKTVTVTPQSAAGVTGQNAYSPITTGSGRGTQVVAAAAAQSGKPYVFGAAGPKAFDCSGLTLYAFKTVGISLPHNADAQKGYGKAVSRSAALPGDLIVFLDGGYGYHAAIYAGNGYMYDAPNSGSTVGKRAIYGGTVIFRRLI